MPNSNYIAGTIRRYNANTSAEYSYFLPSPLPATYIPNDPKLGRLLEEATHSLGELNAYARFVPDIDYFIRMHETKEATASSKIEGARTNMDEALMREQDVAPERRDDWHEVQNYIRAMKFALGELNRLPLVSRLLDETHQVLLQGVRGAGKQPGHIRVSQNWIGGATLRDAKFVPPHNMHVRELLSDLEHFLNEDNLTMPLLLKAGMAHYQFESIHPYLDGNGRLGRLLIILYLIQQKLLDKPILYLSQFFEEHRQDYYDALTAVRRTDDIEQWLRFFLVGVNETSKKAITTLQSIMQLRQDTSELILQLGKRAERAGQLINHLYQDPIISVNAAAEILSITPQSANSLVSELVRLGVLVEITGFERNRLFRYEKYVALFEEKRP
ncbi:MAG: Fic family protein [Candidatus Saccharibacteria bacterium]